jgi:hypothetical protein
MVSLRLIASPGNATPQRFVMKLEFHEVELLEIGARTSAGDHMTATVNLSFVDIEAKLISDVKVRVFVPRSPDVTFSGLQESARANAVALLREALSTLEQNDFPSLEKLSEGVSKSHMDIMFSDSDKTD